MAAATIFSARAQSQELRDGALALPLPPAWSIWSAQDIHRANPDTAAGMEILAQAAEFPFGHAGFNPTITLGTIDPGASNIEASEAGGVAAELLDQMRLSLPGFRPRGASQETLASLNVPAARWEGTVTLPLGSLPLDVDITQVVVLAGTQPRVVTFMVPAKGPHYSQLVENLISQIRLDSQPGAAAPQPPTPAAPVGSRWTLGPLSLPVPEDWIAWTEEEIAAAHAAGLFIWRGAQDVAPVQIIAAERFQPGVFVPHLAAEVEDWSGLEFTPNALSLCRRAGDTTIAALESGGWTAHPLPIAVGGRPAARGEVHGMLSTGGTRRDVRVLHLWVAADRTAVHLVGVIEEEDEEAREAIELAVRALAP